MSQQGFYRCCSLALIALSLLALSCAWWVTRTGVHIDTNLRSLSPSFNAEDALNSALNRMSSAAAQQFILVLVGADEDRVYEASDALAELIEQQQSGIGYVDQNALLDRYSQLLSQHSFNLLGPQAQAALSAADSATLLQLGASNLYGAAGTLRLVPVTQDPLGFANEYALALPARLGMGEGDEIQAISRAGSTQFISVHRLQLSRDGLEMAQQDQALASIRQIAADLAQGFPDVELVQSGILFFAADAAQSAKADINTISTGSLLGVLLLILLLFRGPRALLLPFLSIALGLLFAFSLCHAWFGSLHILTLVFGASLIGVVVDYALHFFYFQARHGAGNNRAALYRALALSLLSSVIGFSALAWSGLAALQQVAVFAVLGLVYAWLVVIVLGHFLTRSVRVYDSGLAALLGWLVRKFALLPSVVVALVGLALLVLGFAAAGFSVPVNDSPRSFFAANPELLAQEREVNDWVASHEPASFVVVQASSAQALYQRIEQVQTRLEPLLAGGAGQLMGVQQFFPSPAEQQHNYALNQQLYQESGLAAQFIQQQGLTGLSPLALSAAYAEAQQQLLDPADFFTQGADLLPPLWIAQADQVHGLLLIPKGSNTQELAQALTELDGVRFFSAMQDAEKSMGLLRQSALQLLALALVLMSVLLLSRYHWKKMLGLMAIPVFAVLASLVMLALLHIPLSLFHVMALFLVVGLGMDYVIFIAEMHEKSVETLCAVSISSATNLLSFGLLGLSILPAVGAFGSALFIGACCNFIGALFLASRHLRSA